MSTHLTLDPALEVLLRPDGTVQVGWDPRRAVRVPPPGGLTCSGLAVLLRSLRSPTPLTQLRNDALRHGLTDAAGLDRLIGALVTAGLITRGGAGVRSGRSASVRVHGSGPLSDLLADALRRGGTSVRHSSLSHAAANPARTDLVVIADSPVADSRMLRDLHLKRIAHLPVRVRDRIGLIGPLVLPGATCCLNCIEFHRRDRDAAWPALAAQLRGTTAHADRATLLGTVGLALHQVNRVIAAVRERAAPSGDPDPPVTLNTTLEFDVHAGVTSMRRWARHPLCGC